MAKVRTKEELLGARRLLRRINKNPPTRLQMAKFAKACGELPERLRGFEGHAITWARLFPEAPDQGESAFFRMAALARLVSERPVPGWAERDGEGLLTLEVLFAAAGEEKVVLQAGEFTFNRASLLKRAFQLAKREA